MGKELTASELNKRIRKFEKKNPATPKRKQHGFALDKFVTFIDKQLDLVEQKTKKSSRDLTRL